MNYSFCLWTASWMAAAPLGAPADSGCIGCAAAQANAPVVSSAPTRSLRDRFRAAFGLPPLAHPQQPVIVRPVVSAESPSIVRTSYAVSRQGSSPQPVLTVVEQHGSQIAPKYQEKVGHEADYSWITGHLFYVHTDGGKWVLRYTGVDEVDRYGGSVVLTPTVEMKNYREGDLVNVYGEVMNNGIPVQHLGGALYRVNSILMVERADP